MEPLKRILANIVKESQGVDYEKVFQEVISMLHGELCRLMSVRDDEVAVLLLDKMNNVRFLRPKYLEKAGFIPYSYTRAFVVKVMQTRTVGIDNRFHSTQHLSLFEDFKKNNPNQIPIQKMLCVPLIRGETHSFGAVQISRKGLTPEKAGPDWRETDGEMIFEYLQPLSDNLYILCKHAGIV